MLRAKCAALVRPAFGAVMLGLALSGTARGQMEEMRAAAALLPDTVHVGDPFRLGVTVRVPRGVQIRLPSVLGALGDLEQVGEAEIGRRRPRTGVARAYYRLVAWTAGAHEVPPVPVQVLPEGEDAEPFEVLVPVPPLTVETVLPADITGLELRQALPFLNPLPFPWFLVLLALALLVGLWAYRRYRKRDEEPEAARREPTEWERALEELRRLAEDWRAGGLLPDAFGDRLESVLRKYLAATESWAPGVPVRAVVNGDRGLANALYYSARVRFARLLAGYGGPIEATDACRAWIVSRHEPADAAAGDATADPGGQVAPAKPAADTAEGSARGVKGNGGSR